MFEVRSFRDEDSPALVALDEEIQREYRGPAWDDLDASLTRTLLWYPDGIPAAADREFLLVAIEAGTLAGFLFAFREPLSPHRLRIDGVAVRAASRREGIAAGFYAELLSRAHNAGIAAMVTRFSLDNEPSQKLHAAAGFRLVECMEAYLELDSVAPARS